MAKTLHDIYQKTKEKLAQAPFIEEPDLEARWLIECFLKAQASYKFEPHFFWANPQFEIAERDILQAIDSALERRLHNEPLAQILGQKEFLGLNFFVDKNVLTPRPETEILIEEIAKRLSSQMKASLKIADFGTGSGCLALSLAHQFVSAEVYAYDVCEKALAVAQKNAKALGLSERVRFILGPLQLSNVKPELFDIIVANPPYIAFGDEHVSVDVIQHEPHRALFSTEQGLGHIKDWLVIAEYMARKNALIGFEIGHQQTEAVKKIVTQTNSLKIISVLKDLQNKDRHVLIEKIDS